MAAVEVECEEHFMASFASDNGIHFYYGGIWMGLDVSLKVFVSAPFKNTGIRDLCFVYVPDLVSHLFWEIHVFYRERAGLDVIVDRLFGQADLRMAVQDGVRGLPLSDQWGNQFVQNPEVFFRQVNARTGLNQDGFILSMGSRCPVIIFVKAAVSPFWTSITYKGGFVQEGAVVRSRDKIGAYAVADMAFFAGGVTEGALAAT